MHMRWMLGALGAFALSAVAGSAWAGGGNPVIDDIPGSCNIFAAPNKCHFSGNITLNNLDLVDLTYNSQDPDVNPNLDLESLLNGEFSPQSDDQKSGSITADFLVDFFAVKGGDQFELYKLDGTSKTFSWNTDDLFVGRGNHPALSHLVWFGHKEVVIDPCVEHPTAPGCGNDNTTVPEPATWAMMLVGFFGAGAAIRRRQALFA